MVYNEYFQRPTWHSAVRYFLKEKVSTQEPPKLVGWWSTIPAGFSYKLPRFCTKRVQFEWPIVPMWAHPFRDWRKRSRHSGHSGHSEAKCTAVAETQDHDIWASQSQQINMSLHLAQLLTWPRVLKPSPFSLKWPAIFLLNPLLFATFVKHEIPTFRFFSGHGR